MLDQGAEPTAAGGAEELLAATADAERRLLKEERKAERRLADARETLRNAEARLLRAQERVVETRLAVLSAEANLRAAQLRRANGPGSAPDYDPDKD